VSSLGSDLKTSFSLSLFHAGPSKEDTSRKKILFSDVNITPRFTGVPNAGLW
jgi:hypothetical protein